MPHVLRSPTSPAPDPSAPPALSDLSRSRSPLSRPILARSSRQLFRLRRNAPGPHKRRSCEGGGREHTLIGRLPLAQVQHDPTRGLAPADFSR